MGFSLLKFIYLVIKSSFLRVKRMKMQINILIKIYFIAKKKHKKLSKLLLVKQQLDECIEICM